MKLSLVFVICALLLCSSGCGSAESKPSSQTKRSEETGVRHEPVKMTFFYSHPKQKGAIYQIITSESWAKKFGATARTDPFYGCAQVFANFNVPDFLMEKAFESMVLTGAARLPSRSSINKEDILAQVKSKSGEALRVLYIETPSFQRFLFYSDATSSTGDQIQMRTDYNKCYAAFSFVTSRHPPTMIQSDIYSRDNPFFQK